MIYVYLVLGLIFLILIFFFLVGYATEKTKEKYGDYVNNTVKKNAEKRKAFNKSRKYSRAKTPKVPPVK